MIFIGMNLPAPTVFLRNRFTRRSEGSLREGGQAGNLVPLAKPSRLCQNYFFSVNIPEISKISGMCFTKFDF